MVKRVPPLILPEVGATEETENTYRNTLEPGVAAIESPLEAAKLT